MINSTMCKSNESDENFIWNFGYIIPHNNDDYKNIMELATIPGITLNIHSTENVINVCLRSEHDIIYNKSSSLIVELQLYTANSYMSLSAEY